MSAGSSTNEIVAFHDFVGTLVRTGRHDLSPEESVSEFRAYQQQLAQFRADNQVAVNQSERGESKALDVAALLDRVQTRIAEEQSL